MKNKLQLIILKSLICLFLFAVPVSKSNAVSINDFDTLQDNLQNSNLVDMILDNDISCPRDLCSNVGNGIPPGISKYLDGGGYAISGDLFSGVIINQGASLSIQDLTMQGFNGYDSHYSGAALSIYSPSGGNGGFLYGTEVLSFSNNESGPFTNGEGGDGGAILVKAQGDSNTSSMTFKDSNVTFTSNTAVAAGGAILMWCWGDGYSRVDFISSTATFIGNIAGKAGGAVGFGGEGGSLKVSSCVVTFTSNTVTDSLKEGTERGTGGAVLIGGKLHAVFENSELNFTGNSASIAGGAISVMEAAIITFKNSSAIYTSNSAQNGGAIYSVGTFKFENSELNFTGNSASIAGGAIYSTGTLNIQCNSVLFDGNIATSSGGAMYLGSSGQTTMDSSSGSIIFQSNSATAGARAGHDIFMEDNHNLFINGTANSVVISSGIAGKGEINKSNLGVLDLGGDNSYYVGRFYQTGGTTTVRGIYFNGVSSITSSVLELASGSSLVAATATATEIGLWDGGILNITNLVDMTIYGGMIVGSADTFINKFSESTLLTLSGDNSSYKGTYSQSKGTTTVPSASKIFGGVNNITNSLLDITMGGAGAVETDYIVNIGTNGVLTHRSEVVDVGTTTIGVSSITFNGNNGSVIFTGQEDESTWYVLPGAIVDSGIDNSVMFSTCYVNIQWDEFPDSTYIFEDAVMDIDQGGGTRTVTFGNLVTEGGTSLNTMISRSSTTVQGSLLISSNTLEQGDQNIHLGLIRIEDFGRYDSGLRDSHTVQLLGGNVKFVERESEEIGTIAYMYKVTVDTNAIAGAGTERQGVLIDAYGASTDESLNDLNKSTTTAIRGFCFGSEDSTNTYHPGSDLDVMSTGSFSVLGYEYDDSIQENKIIAKSTTTEARVSLFKVDNPGTNFEIMDLRILQAYGEYGSALRVTSSNTVVEIINVEFEGNESTGSAGGGAVCVLNGASPEFSNVKFINNIASGSGNGGAISIVGATATLAGANLEITGNSAGGHGGGVYVENGTLNIDIAAGSTATFSGNMGGDVPEGIYLKGTSVVNFNGAEGATVSMKDAIGSDEMIAGLVNVNGTTEFVMDTSRSGKARTVVPNLRINDSALFTIVGETEISASSSIFVGESATLKIDGTAGQGHRVPVGSMYEQQGTVYMNLFSPRGLVSFAATPTDQGSYNEGDSDLIDAENGHIELGINSKLGLTSHGAFSDVDSFTWRVYRLMRYASLSGEFSTYTVTLDGSDSSPKQYELRYDFLGEHYIVLLVQGNALTRKRFVDFDLCFNQTEVAKTFDYFYDALGVPTTGSTLGDTLIDLQGKIDEGSTTARSIEEYKEALFDFSGYFISNVIISRAYDEAKRDVYNRVYNYKEYEEPTKGIWAQVKGAIIDTDKDVESPNKFKVNNTGILVGFDMMTSSDVTCGVYAKQNKSSISQGNDLHKGEVKSYGLGLYGGIVKEKYDIKGLASVSGDNYETTRALRFNSSKAKGEFSGISGILDIEAGYRIGIASSSALGKIKLRPYAGAEVALVHTNGFNETGADIWNLEVKKNNYIRAELGGGIGFTGEGRRFRWNVSCGIDFMLTGKNEEITSKFMGGNSLPGGIANQDFRSRSVTLDVLSVKSEVGFGYYVLDGLEAYCSGDIKWSSMVKDMYGNIGLRYSFGKWVNKNISEIETGNKKIRQFRINAVLFEFDKADIKPEAEEEIKKLVKKIGKRYKFEKIRIEGHTDSEGSDAYNLKLSHARAHAVHEIFAKYGIDVAKMEKIGHGESKPIETNETEEGRAKNRRVEIFVDLY